jgi:molybdopterin-guanine dinucleotide biosynthesis protein A
MRVAVVILAGGQSRRMGQDKALLSVAGVPLLRRVYDVAQACTAEVYVVTPWPERYQAVLPADCHWLPETPPHQGPLRAFQRALHQVTADWILLLACDLPWLDAEIMQQWLLDLENIPKHSIAYLAPQVKGWEALCGCYRSSNISGESSCRSSLDAFIHSGGQSFQQWLQSNTVTPMLTVEPQIFTNWNYPEDLQLLP